MISTWKKSMFTIVALIAGTHLLGAQVQFRVPQTGDVYKEFSRVMEPGTYKDWRVTDPNYTYGGSPGPGDFLPNSVLDLTIDDLTGAISAEAVITIWGGHVGTTGKKIRFNGNSWISIPELDGSNGIPSGHSGQCYTQQLNVVVDVPLSDIFEGTNNFQGEAGGQTCYNFGWGQFGWYAVMVRVYYDPATKTHPTGSITSPVSGGTFDDNPTVTATVSAGVDRVDVLAYYEGYDTDGDGISREYHSDYHIGPSETEMNIKNHVGTVTSAPFEITWNTQWVPDQEAGGVKLIARIRNSSGLWFVTDEVVDLSLRRTGKSVKLYPVTGMPENAWTNTYGSPVIVNATIPGGDNVGDATAVAYHVRTWNGLDSEREPGENHFRRLNGWYDGEFGGNHTYSYDVRTVPTNQILQGTNVFEFNSETSHHGIEVLWPGPALSVEFTGDYASPKPPAPTLFSPSDAAVNRSTMPVLRWHPATSATSYRLQVAGDPSFSSMIVDDSTLTDTLSQVGPLASLTTFYWRVNAKNAAGVSGYSTVWSFTTSVGAPVLISPVEGATGQPTSLMMSWHAVQGATGYHLQVSADTTFGAGLVWNDSTLADTSSTVSGLQHERIYYWRAAARTSSGRGDFSLVRSFTTAAGVPPPPTLVSPLDNAANQPATLTFLWRTAGNAETYHIQVSSDSLFSSGFAANDSTLTDTTAQVNGLAYETRYFWRVRGKGPGGNGVFSPAKSFTTSIAPPGPVSLILPADGSMSQPIAGLTFKWDSDADASWYRFQLATDSTFSSGIVKNDSTLTDTSRIVSGLSQSTRYFWRVQGRNVGGSGTFSPVWSFVTYQPLPGQVELISPAHLATLSADSATFAWFRSGDQTTRYWFEIGVDSSFTMFTSVDSTVTDTTKVFGPLTSGKVYYWRVRGRNDTEWGPFSLTRSFSVLITGVEQNELLPNDYTLSQNYPNPFNPATRIQFGIPREAHVRIDVYNALGERVRVLFDGVAAAGFHAVQFEASRLPSGVYLYRLTSSDVSLHKKMLLVK
jgi:hypothetical protein